jgi:uncharacterized protein YbjQ (UPF0145 family)
MADFLLLRRGGYEPVGVVASTSVFYVGLSWRISRAAGGSWQRYMPNQEMTDFTRGVYDAREMALARASTQAERAGAGGIVGVRIDHEVELREDEQTKRTNFLATFHVVGTAIAPHGAHRALDPAIVVRQGAPTR